jgi:hypothetical protein
MLDSASPLAHNPRMRVITWNMGMARESRGRPGLHEQAWHYLLGLGPDLAFVQEALPPSWVRGEGTLIHGPLKQWGSALLSPRYPLEGFRLPDGSNLRNLGTYLALATASLPDGTDAFVASVHARAAMATQAQLGDLQPGETKRPSARAARVNDAFFAGLQELVGDRFIITGDWNTAREQGSEYGNKVGGEFFERARDRGWHDCVWEKRGEELRTWFGAGQIRQDDHAFCDRSLGKRLGSPWVAEQAATDLGLSHHAPLILDFNIEPIAMTSLRDGIEGHDEASASGAAIGYSEDLDHSRRPDESGS